VVKHAVVQHAAKNLIVDSPGALVGEALSAELRANSLGWRNRARIERHDGVDHNNELGTAVNRNIDGGISLDTTIDVINALDAYGLEQKWHCAGSCRGKADGHISVTELGKECAFTGV
jgi:hypothetical protein